MEHYFNIAFTLNKQSTYIHQWLSWVQEVTISIDPRVKTESPEDIYKLQHEIGSSLHMRLNAKAALCHI